MFATAGRPLQRGNAYRALVYTPRPTTARAARRRRSCRCRAATGGTRPHVDRPAGRARRRVGPAVRIVDPRVGRGRAVAADDVAAIEASPYAGVYELARRLRASAQTPYEYVRAIERHLARRLRLLRGPAAAAAPRSRTSCCASARATASSSPARWRCCCAWAACRRGSRPASRRASLDRERSEYVVRDVDAHSWVEVYFPGIGWVTRDPTPGDAPARSQTADVASTGGGSATPLRDALPAEAGSAARSRTPSGRPPPAARSATASRAGHRDRARGARAGRGRRWRSPCAGAGARRADADRGAGQLAELRRALRRSGRAASPQTTLEALAARWRGTPAEGYVRVLAAARYGYGRRSADARRSARRCAASWPPASACAGACARGGRCRRARAALTAHEAGRRAALRRTRRPCRSRRVVSSTDGLARHLRPLPERHAPARGPRLPRRRRPARPRARPRARQDLDPRGARPGAVRLPALRRGGRGVRGRRRARADERLRAVLPRPLAAAARPPHRGAQAARARLLPAPRARRLPHVPRPLARPRAPDARSRPKRGANCRRAQLASPVRALVLAAGAGRPEAAGQPSSRRSSSIDDRGCARA